VRAALAFVWLCAACGQAEQPAEAVRSRGNAEVGGDVVATVDGVPITVAEVERAARLGHVSPETALRRLEDELLLARAAEAAGVDAREARQAVRRAAVQRLLAAEVEPVTEVDEAEIEAAYAESPDRYARPERRRSLHVMVAHAVGEAGEAWIRELHARAAAAEDPVSVLLGVRRRPTGEPPFDVVVEEVEPFAPDADTDPAYLAALFGPGEEGLLPDVVRTEIGWHVVHLSEIQPAERPTREEAGVARARRAARRVVRRARAAEPGGARPNRRRDHRGRAARGARVSPIERSWAREAPRDQDESAFTPILRRLLYRTTGVLAVCFVDDQGECIDYCSSLTAYDAKVTGAHLCVVMNDVARALVKIGGGESWLLHINGDQRDIVARRVSAEYLLVAVLKPNSVTRRLLGGVEHAVSELRRESGVGIPSWEPSVDSVSVEVREAVGWPYAPAAFHDGGRRIAIENVLGRWAEGASAGRLCFRVRTETGEELTLVHDRAWDRWERHRERGDG
jgi:predicted regulator of Ras-like GTPase activity (Roadblock/LC7/MglB family)